MSDLISREEAISAISRYGSVWVEYMDVMSKSEIAGKALKSAKDEMICILKDLPDAEKKGKWMPVTVSSGRDSWECSVCGRRARGKTKNLPYCHCGAKMEVTE